MSRRNFILLIIVSIIVTTSVLLFFYFNRSPNQDQEDNGGFFSNLNPFSGVTNAPPHTTPPDNTDNIDTETNNDTTNEKLTKVSTMPIAGFTVFQKKEGEEFVPALRYVAKTTGNIYQTLADEIKEMRFSSTIVPKVYEALFGDDGEVVIMRYLKSDEKTIQTFLSKLPEENAGEETIVHKIEGSFLPDNIPGLGLSPDTTKLFYLVNTGDVISGVVLDLKNNKKTQVFDSSFTEWLPSWPNSKMITLNTKPSGLAPGYMYSIDPNKKDFIRVMDEISGLTTLVGPDGQNVLYNDQRLALSIYNINTKESSSVGLNTLPEKCVWSKKSDNIYCAIPKILTAGLYPDLWYKGVVSFRDEIWKIDLDTGITTKIIDPVTVPGGEDIDSTKLMLDTEESYLFFVNKKDSYLWRLNLK